jgi:hypothetical protein
MTHQEITVINLKRYMVKAEKASGGENGPLTFTVPAVTKFAHRISVHSGAERQVV